LANGPPDPKVRPKLQEALERYAPGLARRASANPMIRANALLPIARFGIREEMKQRFGYAWREEVRGVTTTLDIADNLAFGEAVQTVLARLDVQHRARLQPGFSLDPRRSDETGVRTPNISVVAANANGEIVRYWEAGETAAYFGSPAARDMDTGNYRPEREPRRIASTAKMLIAIAAGNTGSDRPDTLYVDTNAPPRGLETCARGNGSLRQGRKAVVAFACSLGPAIEWRGATLGQARIRSLVDGFGFHMPPASITGEATPPSTAAARGLVSGSPRQVHHMSSVILAALSGRAERSVQPPSLVKSWELASRASAPVANGAIVPARLIRPHATGFLAGVLSAPLCYQANGGAHGTLKDLKNWCARNRPGVALHFAKTGTDTNADPNEIVDTWITGGIRFENGRSYSYVVQIGTASTNDPFARRLNAGALLVPLVEALLTDLEAAQRSNTIARGPKPTAG
jgi:hypothetical protein